jgi:hypothetical protein
MSETVMKVAHGLVGTSTDSTIRQRLKAFSGSCPSRARISQLLNSSDDFFHFALRVTGSRSL